MLFTNSSGPRAASSCWSAGDARPVRSPMIAAGRIRGFARAREQESGAEQRAPAALECLILVQRGVQAVPRDGRHDRVDPRVGRGGHQLDTTAVRIADHADLRIAGAIEIDLGLRRQPADDRRNVFGLEVRRVDLQLPARVPFTARVPGDDVVAVMAQREDPDDLVRQELVLRGVWVRRTRQPQARTIEDRRGLLPSLQSRRRHEMNVDGGAVERDHLHFRGTGVSAGRPGCTG